MQQIYRTGRLLDKIKCAEWTLFILTRQERVAHTVSHMNPADVTPAETSQL